MPKPKHTQWEQSNLVPVTVLQDIVGKLLIHNERGALRTGFIELIEDWYQPQNIQLFTGGHRGFMAHRGQALSDIVVKDLLDADSAPIKLADNHAVFVGVESRLIQAVDIAESNKINLYVPILQNDDVGAVLVLEGVSFEPVHKQLVWEQMLAAYNNLNRMLYSAEIDPLTGLMNRQAFDHLLNQVASDNERSFTKEKATYFVLADIDFFKAINDNFGHLYGDEVLIWLARIMSESFRSMDWLFRYGGEEFAIVLHDISDDQAFLALDRFRSKIEQTCFPQVEKVTISIGFSRMVKFEAISNVIDRADHALYYAKNHGRNQVMCYEDLITKGLLKQIKQEIGEVELF